MNCYKLNYSVSKKRINDLIHKGLEYEKEHNIKQPEKETIRSLKDSQNKLLKKALELACERVVERYSPYEIANGYGCNPNYFVNKAKEILKDETNCD